MNQQLCEDITTRLISDYSFKPKNGWLREGECPACGQKEAYTHGDAPWVIKCARGNKCGTDTHIKELFADLFDDWSERHPATPENPNAAADNYLATGRGFTLEKIKGWYQQDSYFSHELKEGSATVRFPLAGNCYWERIIDRAWRFGDRKANFKGSYGGTWWQAPNLSVLKVKRLWLVEGIFDAIALLHHGIPAVSLMTCYNYPHLALKALKEQCGDGERPQLVVALDGDKAGAKETKKIIERLRLEGWDAIAAQIPQTSRKKQDWNDLHQIDQINDKTLTDCLYHGALLMAASAGEKAMLMYQHGERRSFYFRFDNRLFWWKVDVEKYTKACEEIEKRDPKPSKEDVRDEAIKAAATLNQIGNFYPQALYYQAQSLTDEAWYYFRVDFPHDGPAMKNTFVASALTSAAEFKKRMLHMAPGAVYSGSSGQLDAIVEDQTFNIKVVQTIDFIGYSKDYKAWVFNDLAVKGGKLSRLNEEDYFDFGKLSVKSLSQSVGLHLNANEKDFTTEWIELIWLSFGAKGIVALAFWFGSLFAEQIRVELASFPFLEVVGEPGSGKTTLIEFLWKLCGRRDYEGFDPSKSTLAARSRNFAQVANMPVVLIEGDREDDAKKGGFDWSELKTAFNGRSTRSRGMKNGGNETHEPPFRGSIVIAQNAPVSAEEAVLSRIVHLHFTKAQHSQEGRASADKLARMDIAKVSGFMLRAVMKEAEVMACIKDRFPGYDKALQERGEIRNQRVAINHAQVMALIDALKLVIPITDEHRNGAISLLKSMAVERQQALNSDHPIVQELWDLYEFIEGGERAEHEASILNHSHGSQEIAISLNHFEQVCADRRLKFPALSDLKRVLKTSCSHKFKEVKSVKSVIHKSFNTTRSISTPSRPDTVWCWVFDA